MTIALTFHLSLFFCRDNALSSWRQKTVVCLIALRVNSFFLSPQNVNCFNQVFENSIVKSLRYSTWWGLELNWLVILLHKNAVFNMTYNISLSRDSSIRYNGRACWWVFCGTSTNYDRITDRNRKECGSLGIPDRDMLDYIHTGSSSCR
jgi:hypothetical protein